MFDIERIITEKSIQIRLQGILSPGEIQTFGVESFVRGIDPFTKEEIPFNELFLAASKSSLENELEKICIEESFAVFKEIYQQTKIVMLYINISSSFYEESIHSNFIYKAAELYQIPPNKIALDISQTSISPRSLTHYIDFIQFHRQQGFYISIDDIGRDYSNLDRIMLLNPDIIKINHQLMASLEHENYRTMLFKYVSELAHKMGILVVSTGIERKEDMIEAVKSGAQLLQGYYIAKSAVYTCNDILALNASFDRSLVFDLVDAQYPGTARNTITNVVNFINTLRNVIEDFTYQTMEDLLSLIMLEYPFIESGFIINNDGLQITDALVNMKSFGKRNKTLFDLFSKNTSFAGEDIFQRLNNNILDTWVTQPYRSKLSNNVCITASFKIDEAPDIFHIVVLNIDIKKFNVTQNI